MPRKPDIFYYSRLELQLKLHLIAAKGVSSLQCDAWVAQPSEINGVLVQVDYYFGINFRILVLLWRGHPITILFRQAAFQLPAMPQSSHQFPFWCCRCKSSRAQSLSHKAPS